MKLRAGCLAFGLAAAALAATIRLEGGPFAPYRINQGRLVLDEGLLGDVELTGRRWSGTRVPLFRTRLAARTQALDLAFYLDEDIRELEVRTGYGEAFPLALETSSPGPAEAAVRARLHDLEPPVRLASREAGPQRFAFRTRGLPEAGIEAASSLFGVPPPRAPLVVLGIFGGIVLAGSVLRSRRQAWAVTVLATAGAAGAVLFLAAPRAAWFSVAFPGGAVPRQVERQVIGSPDGLRVAYRAPGDDGTLALVGFVAPAGRGIPAGSVAPQDSRVRFSSPPCLTEAGRLESEDFVTGWVLHDPR